MPMAWKIVNTLCVTLILFMYLYYFLALMTLRRRGRISSFAEVRQHFSPLLPCLAALTYFSGLLTYLAALVHELTGVDAHLVHLVKRVCVWAIVAWLVIELPALSLTSTKLQKLLRSGERTSRSPERE